MLRARRPRRLIEVGSDFSSLLTADVNRRFLDGALDFTCIEPYPREFLKRGVPGIARLVESRVERVGLGTFAALEPGDVLFIDSSHVAKTGSDVNFLYFEVLPSKLTRLSAPWPSTHDASRRRGCAATPASACAARTRSTNQPGVSRAAQQRREASLLSARWPAPG
jgi:hypothetical protein